MCRADGQSHARDVRQDGPLLCCKRDICQIHAMNTLHKTDGRLKRERNKGRQREREKVSEGQSKSETKGKG